MDRINHKTEVISMEFVKKSLFTLSMVLFVATPLSAIENEYIPKIVKWENKKTGKKVYVFHDVHTKNYEELIKTYFPQYAERMQDTITEVDDDTHNQLSDIINAAKQLDAAIIVEGRFVDEPNKRSSATEKKFNETFLPRNVYKQATANDMCVENAEARSCPDCPVETVLVKYGLDNPATAMAYFQGELPVYPSLSKELDVAFEQTIKNYAAAYKKHREKLNNSEDGPVAEQYYDEMMEPMNSNYFHRLLMNPPTEKKQPMENENPAYIGKEQQIDSLQKKAILKTQATKLQHLNLITQLRINNITGGYGLIETNIIHNIVNDKEHDTIFVVAGAVHCQNFADPLTKLGYEKEETIERNFENNTLHRPIPGFDSQCIPVHIKEYFDDMQKNESAS